MDVRDIVELVNLVAARDITELELEREGVRLRIVRHAGRAHAPAVVERIEIPSPAASVSLAAAGPVATAPLPAPAEEGVHIIKAPIVGTFYRSPSPSAQPYVQPGDRVKKGQVICIVEAMKLMNEIESDVAGVVVETLIEDGQPVEYGEPLFKVRLDK